MFDKLPYELQEYIFSLQSKKNTCKKYYGD